MAVLAAKTTAEPRDLASHTVGADAADLRRELLDLEDLRRAIPLQVLAEQGQEPEILRKQPVGKERNFRSAASGDQIAWQERREPASIVSP